MPARRELGCYHLRMDVLMNFLRPACIRRALRFTLMPVRPVP